MQNIKVIYEDDDLIVINKPAGITVNRSDTTRNEKTVQDFIEEKFIGSRVPFKKDESDFYKRAGIVHRLDKETSGILLVAKNEDSFKDLQRQFKERVVKKTYLALAHGKIKIKEGEIKAGVGRLPWNRKRFGILAGGRESVTKYKVLKYLSLNKNKNNFYSLVELYPETGRTHQIRVHLKYINHPIFADSLYAGRKTSRDDRKMLERVSLHASKISFTHPKTLKQIMFESPLPLELEDFIKKELNESD